jgi:hypothetical protein
MNDRRAGARARESLGEFREAWAFEPRVGRRSRACSRIWLEFIVGSATGRAGAPTPIDKRRIANIELARLGCEGRQALRAKQRRARLRRRRLMRAAGCKWPTAAARPLRGGEHECRPDSAADRVFRPPPDASAPRRSGAISSVERPARGSSMSASRTGGEPPPGQDGPGRADRHSRQGRLTAH